MQSWYTIRARETGAELSIYDEIGAFGVSAKDFIADLRALPSGAALDLRLNSPGGSVFDAVAIYNALKRHDGPVTVTIDGIAASAAAYVAMASDTIVMPENAFLMIHDPSGLVMGTAADMRAMAEALEKIAASLLRGYAAKSGRPVDEIAAWMAAETWFDAAEAQAAGFADRIGEPVRIAAHFDIARFRNAPPDLVDAVAANNEPGEATPATEDGEDDAAPDEAAGDAGTDDDAADEAMGDGAARTDPEPPPLPEAEAPSPAASTEPDAPDPAAIRAEAMAHARAVLDLCRLAGQPQMAAGFLEKETSLEAVRKALLETRARTEPEITAAHPQPGPGPAARPWGDVIARTFKRKD
jgi:ATP-dependent protease ClpP protease subunit